MTAEEAAVYTFCTELLTTKQVSDATFETTAPTWDAFNASRLPDHRFVAVDEDGKVLGWVAVVPVSDRCAYAGVVEHSVYVHPAARGQTRRNARRKTRAPRLLHRPRRARRRLPCPRPRPRAALGW